MSLSGQSVLTAASIVFGLLFLVAGCRKCFTDWEWGRTHYLKHHPLWVNYASGAIEIATGIGLMIPVARFVSALALAIMIVAVSAHPWKSDWKKFIVPAVVFPIFLVAIAWFSRPTGLFPPGLR